MYLVLTEQELEILELEEAYQELVDYGNCTIIVEDEIPVGSVSINNCYFENCHLTRHGSGHTVTNCYFTNTDSTEPVIEIKKMDIEYVQDMLEDMQKAPIKYFEPVKKEVPVSPYDYPWAQKKQEQEKVNAMCYGTKAPQAIRADINVAAINTGDAAAQQKQSYLRNRLERIYYAKKDDLMKTFGLVDDEAPNTFEELLARIQAGKYVIDEKDAKKRAYLGLDYLRWRDPAVKEDRAGFDAAKEELKKEKQLIEDQIAIADPAVALPLVQALETWQPSGKAN